MSQKNDFQAWNRKKVFPGIQMSDTYCVHRMTAAAFGPGTCWRQALKCFACGIPSDPCKGLLHCLTCAWTENSRQNAPWNVRFGWKSRNSKTCTSFAAEGLTQLRKNSSHGKRCGLVISFFKCLFRNVSHSERKSIQHGIVRPHCIAVTIRIGLHNDSFQKYRFTFSL